MEFSLKQALKVFLIFACAIGVASASIIITNKNNDNAKSKNDSLWNVVKDDNSDNGGADNNTPTNGPNGEPLVSKTESQVRKYADIDGDGTVDGIIFADLLFGESGQWNDDNDSTYSVPTISSSKDYYVSQTSYTNELGDSTEVLTPTGNGAERFYIMALQDVNSDLHDWYNSAKTNHNYQIITSPDFGTGRQNTLNMIDNWNNEDFGKQNACEDHTDMWNEIQEQANNGWFVPSKQEWAVFAQNIGITDSNYSSKGLSSWYWSSSQNRGSVYLINLYRAYLINCPSSYFSYVRLATTF